MKGRPPGRGGKSTKVISKPKVDQVRKARSAAASKKANSPSYSNSISGGNSTCDHESISSDPSETNFPYDLRINGVQTLLNIIHKATPEVKDLFMDECEIILECRICRNLFRSFPNFICHKHQFCRKPYHPATQPRFGPLMQCAENLYQLQYQIDSTSRQSPDVNTSINRLESGSNLILGSSAEVKAEQNNTRLDSIVAKLTSSWNVVKDEPDEGRSTIGKRTGSSKRKSMSPMKGLYHEENGVLFPKIRRNCLNIEPLVNRAQDGIVFQSLLSSGVENSCDKYMLPGSKNDSAVLDVDGKVMFVGIQQDAEMVADKISKILPKKQAIGSMIKRDSNLDLQCSSCQTQFSTEKTLRLHARKSNCNSLGYVNNSEVLNNNKRLLDSTEDTFKTENGQSLSLVNATQLTMNSSPTKSLMHKRRKTSNRTDCNTAKENKSIIRSIFGPKKSSSPIINSKVPQDTATVQNINKARTNGKYKSTIDYRTRYKAQNERQDLPLLSTCIKCSSSFSTKSEMSSHLALCTGVINLAFQRSIWSPEKKKICIQIRHNYEKEQSDNCVAQQAITPAAPESTEQSQSPPVCDAKANVIHTEHFNNNVNEKQMESSGASEVPDGEDKELPSQDLRDDTSL